MKTNMINYCCFLLTYALVIASADEMELYNTKLATSDLDWDKHSIKSGGGWEEVSSFGANFTSTIRSYQTCDVGLNEVDNWIRSPYILSSGGKQIHLEVEFSISRCDDSLETSACKETFNIFYYEADRNIASSTFPPWQENPYKKVDTVAANNAGKINKKTFDFGPVSRKGFYIAVQDRGACMSLISIRAYYYYCPATTVRFVAYPRTVSETGVASLVTVRGKCIRNAVHVGNIDRLYRCGSDGKWQIPTGECECNPGYQPIDTDCIACATGTYKVEVGPGRCAPCPVNSGYLSSSPEEGDKHNQCPCHPGHARGEGESIALPCSKPPSKPVSLLVVTSNATSAYIQWNTSVEEGERKDLFYRFVCEVSHVSLHNSWKTCPSTIKYIAPTRDKKFYQTNLVMTHLDPYKNYRITVCSQNSAFASIDDINFSTSASSVIFQTNQSVPSAVEKVRPTKQTPKEVSLIWEEPTRPNGVIIGYEVRLHPLFHENIDSYPRSISNWTVNNFIQLRGLLEDTKYEVHIRAKTLAGYGPYNDHYTIRTLPASESREKPISSSLIIAVLAIFFVLVISLFLLIIFRYRKTGKLLCLNTAGRRRRSRGRQDEYPLQLDNLLRETLIVDLPPPRQQLYVEYPDPHAVLVDLGCEIKPDYVQTEELVGEGEFAEVYRGKMKTADAVYEEVAVKKLKPKASEKDRSNFLREASTLVQFKHPNVVAIKGAVTKNDQLMIVTEYMTNKSLDRFLQLNQGGLIVVQLVEMLKGIASGMRYLSNMNYVHRDLAARNILVDSNLVCKVSDFGLSRSLENNPHATYTTQGGKIAIRWTAIESILFRKFTSASDVWSYGIVMWEVMSYGEKPYWDISNDDVIKNIQSGLRLPAPKGCPEVLHDLMLHCWHAEPHGRPTFVEIAGKLDSLLGQPMLLLPDVAYQTTLPCNNHLPNDIPVLEKAFAEEEAMTVQKWLELQRLGKYFNHFKERGIDNLEKVCNLTINDLKSMGIDVTLHINKLESGIETLKRHLSSSSTPPSNRSTSLNNNHDEDQSTSPSTPHEGVLV